MLYTSALVQNQEDPKTAWEELTEQGKVFASLADAVAAAQKGKKK